MKFLFSQKHGNTTVVVILENPEIKEGIVYATKVGAFEGWGFEHEEIYKSCPPVKFIAGGGPWCMTEYTDELQ